MTTVGILLVIPEPYGGELQVRRAAYGDPPVSGVPAHVTLLPPTEVEPAQLPGIEEHLALVAADVEPRIPADTAWHPVQDLPPTAFDHGSIAESGRDRLRAKLSYTNIGFALAPATFTIARLRDIYAASVGYPVSATNLQRVLTRRGVIEATPGAARPTPLGGRPATLYRFAARTLIVTNPFAAFRPPHPPQAAAQ